MTGFGADSTSTASSPPTAKWRNTARIGRPRASATERSAISIAAAPSEVCDELPAVMSGAIAGSHFAADCRPARISTVVSGRIPSSASMISPVSAPCSSLTATGRISVLNAPETVASWARRCDSAANAVHVLAADPVALQRIWLISNCVISCPSITSRYCWVKGPRPPDAFDAIGTRLIDSTPHATAMS